MAQQKAVAEINKFVGGFVSDASPLTFPENTSLVDINMELNIDGSRQRALGIDLEADYVEVETGITSADISPIGYNSFKWENVGGDPLRTILCVQFANQVKFFSLDEEVVSSNLIDTYNFSINLSQTRFSFTSVDGNLIIAVGTNEITTVVYEDGSLSYSTDTIKVRDFFGVEDVFGSQDLTTGSGVQVRPSSLTNAHQYNLRNQGFAIPRIKGDPNHSNTLKDPIYWFQEEFTNIKGSRGFPSNADIVTEFLYADANESSDRNSRRYFPADAVKNPLGSSRAPMGHYVIDILDRGTSRKAATNQSEVNYPELYYKVGSLPRDYTPGGATVVGEFAGRVWYGGFSGEVVDGDSKSPKLSSYVAFSQLVVNPSMITNCYQEGDPTSDNEPDIIDTDGGYIRLNNAYGICSFINLGSSLFIGAANGVWRIYGGNDSGFTATNYVVEKLTDKGIRGPKTVVQVENTMMYWSDDGIYHVKQNEFGDWISENQTQGRIQKFYNDISTENKEYAIGSYDAYQRKVRWLYNNKLYEIEQQKELILDTNLGAFYERHISQLGDVPIVIGSFNTNPFKVETVIDPVTVGGVAITVGLEAVEITTSIRSSLNTLYEIGYVVVTQLSPLKYTFAAHTDASWLDWKSVDGVGIDAPATLITGAASGGDNMRFKQIPYLYIHSRRTEDGFVVDENGDFVPRNQSSCMVQSIWDWTNSANSNKWGTPFQAYRYKRVYFPTDINDTFDTGYETVVTKNKLRGRGRAISLKFTSTPGKEMHLYGWSLLMAANTNV
jgi:hypothetical protein